MNKLYKLLIAFIVLAMSIVYPTLVANSAVTCFFKSEYTSGFNKICTYSCVGSDVAITIGATELCPLTIQR